MSRSLLVLPDDSIKPILDMINGAAKSLPIKLFSFSEPRLVDALLRARRRGVAVRVMLNPPGRSGTVENANSSGVLRNGRVEVLDSNPSFAVTHEKSMIVDDKVALIGSLNWDAETFERNRDYAVVTADEKEVREITDCFEADWSRQPFHPPGSSSLIWCPGMGRSQVGAFIGRAEHSLVIQNERYQDAIIVDHIVRAKMRGVRVHVMSRPSHSLRTENVVEGVGDLRIMQDVGIKVRRLKHFKLHAKMLLADRSRAIIGSINLTAGSFDKRRELAIRVEDPGILSRLWTVVHQDWKHSHPLDISDEGVLKDLRKHARNDSRSIVSEISSGGVHTF